MLDKKCNPRLFSQFVLTSGPSSLCRPCLGVINKTISRYFFPLYFNWCVPLKGCCVKAHIIPTGWNIGGHPESWSPASLDAPPLAHVWRAFGGSLRLVSYDVRSWGRCSESLFACRAGPCPLKLPLCKFSRCGPGDISATGAPPPPPGLHLSV